MSNTRQKPADEVNVDELLEVYRAAAKEHGHLLDHGRPGAANRPFDITQQIARELSRRGEILRLVTLWDDEDPGVRLCSAGQLLPLMPETAVPVLELLSDAYPGTVLGLSAAANLFAWRREEKGRRPS